MTKRIKFDGAWIPGLATLARNDGRKANSPGMTGKASLPGMTEKNTTRKITYPVIPAKAGIHATETGRNKPQPQGLSRQLAALSEVVPVGPTVPPEDGFRVSLRSPGMTEKEKPPGMTKVGRLARHDGRKGSFPA